MSFRSAIFYIAVLVLLGSTFVSFTRPELSARAPAEQSMANQRQIATASIDVASSSPIISVSTTSIATPNAQMKKSPTKEVRTVTPNTPSQNATSTPQPKVNQASRIQSPYPFPPFEFSAINETARAALVNILCVSKGGNMRSVTGSGIIIDPRGIILTNAHVAQYVLLSQSPDVNLSCVIRSGSPAVARWKAHMLYIPPIWVNAHAGEIIAQQVVGTGEHDYALLRITEPLDGSPLPASFTSIPVDTREAIGFEGDQVLAASYPAEFSAGNTDTVYAASSITTVQRLLTFDVNSVDLVSLGGIIEAQSGSSGGAIVNAWGRLIGIIVTTSEGQTTGQRDLHALTMSYISRDFTKQTNHTIADLFSGDIASIAADFNANIAPDLIKKYINVLSAH